MLSGIRRILGNIKVEEDEYNIRIDGLPADVIERDISRIWKTSRFTKHMFVRISRSSIVFPKFFAIEIIYILEELTKQRSRYINIRTMAKIRDLMYEHTWIGDTQITHKPIIDESKIRDLIYKPTEYQQTFIDHYNQKKQELNLRGYLLSAAPGSGKTYMQLLLGHILDSDHIVIICPKNAVDRVWIKEAQTLFRKPQSIWVYAHKKPFRGERILIAHYEGLEQMNEIARTLRGKKVYVGLDESHNLNDIKSLRTQRYLEFVDRVDASDVIHASGTPIKALGSEAIPLLRAIDTLFTDDAEGRFKRIYGSSGNQGLDILKHRIGLVAFKVEKHEIGNAPPIIKTIKVNMPTADRYTLQVVGDKMAKFIEERFQYYKKRSKEDHKFYFEMIRIHQDGLRNPREKDELGQYMEYVKLIKRVGAGTGQVSDEIVATNRYEKEKILPSLPQEYRKRFVDVKSAVKYPELKIRGEALGRILGGERVQCHVDMVPHIPFQEVCNSTEKKTVVFTSFVEALRETERHLKDQGMNPLVVYGETNKDLDRIITTFGDHEDLNPLVATYQSLSTAVPLTMADTMIMINTPFREYIYNQAIARIDRKGATTQTYVYEASLDTGTQGNLSTRSKDIMEWSKEQVNAIMGMTTDFNVDSSVESVDPDKEIVKRSDLLIEPEQIRIHSKMPSYLSW